MQKANIPFASDHWLDQPVGGIFQLKWETLIFISILIVAFFTRFYDLESRVMSHDETSHVYFSWLLYRGQGYAHDPVTHGPLQFHLVALAYFLFGDNDLTARIPAALFSITTVALAWLYRRYLGRTGALLAAGMLLISPFILYYGRYVRNEAFVGVFFMLNLWAILRYLETGHSRYMILLTLALVFHFTAKETAFIYTAQTLLFLGLYFIYRVTQFKWEDRRAQSIFLICLIVGILLFTIAFSALTFYASKIATPEQSETSPGILSSHPLEAGLIILSFIFIAISLFFLARGYGVRALRAERSFSLMLVVFTLVLPQLSPFAMNFTGVKIPVNATQVSNLSAGDLLQMGVILIPFFLVAIGMGLWWNPRQWLINAGIFYSIFTVLYTTIFTNGAGFFTGLVGSLGYWLAQQEVERGSQPIYYYLLIQIPIYEYLPALGVPIAFVIRGLQYLGKFSPALKTPPENDSELNQPAPVFPLIAFWTITSALAFTIAGEKMPWLTFHIALPMILTSAWGFGQLIDSLDWKLFGKQHSWLAILVLPVFFSSTGVVLGSLLGPNPPFQGQSLEQLSQTSTFLVALIISLASGTGLAYWMKNWSVGQTLRILTLFTSAFLALLTIRTAFRAAYINYDNATEYLVYAHSGPGVKVALKEIEELSKRLTGTLDLAVAYDNETTYPYWWYLRNYPKQRYYGANPTRDLREVPVILVGDRNYSKIEPIVGKAFYQFDYIRIWWPDQDYFGLTWERIANAIRNPEMRAAIFKIWLDRDYTDYARLTGKDMSLSNWYPSARMRLYIRKDIASQIWKFGASEEVVVEADPYEGKEVQLIPDIVIGSQGSSPGQFEKPRNLAIAPDGTIYVADTGNHRIQHLTKDGTILHVWGSFADAAQGSAPGGTFNEPWGIAVDSGGFVYVADTWNHRIQKFTPDGRFLLTWGYFGQAETPQGYWGPRGLAIDQNNRVYITDTGNKRVVVFDSEGTFITEFGISGYLPGEFNEPVGLAFDPNGALYITDTWNQRVQVMAIDESNTFQPIRQWDIVGWYGQSLDNKPYIAVDQKGRVFTSDPEGYRILEFDSQGNLIRYWGAYGAGEIGLNLPTGLAIDPEGGLWVADTGNHRILRFIVP